MRWLFGCAAVLAACLAGGCGDGGAGIAVTGVTVDPVTMRFAGGPAAVSAQVTSDAAVTRVYARLTDADGANTETDLAETTGWTGTVTVPANDRDDGTAETVTLRVIAVAGGDEGESAPVSITVEAAPAAPAPPAL